MHVNLPREVVRSLKNDTPRVNANFIQSAAAQARAQGVPSLNQSHR